MRQIDGHIPQADVTAKVAAGLLTETYAETGQFVDSGSVGIGRTLDPSNVQTSICKEITDPGLQPGTSKQDSGPADVGFEPSNCPH